MSTLGYRSALARGAAVTGLLAAFSVGCKHDEPPAPAAKPPLVDPSATALHAGPQASSSASAASSSNPTPPPPHPKPGPTADEVVLEARGRVADAVQHASGKDVCGVVLPLLDVSYSIVRASTPLDEHTLTAFATCAAQHERWRLLRDLAEAIAAGERKQETTYFLPRALVGEADYDVAHTLAKATLRAWPTEGEAYNTGALAALRMKDWDGAMKAADQALLLQRKHSVNNEVTALAHALRGAALLRMGKTEEGIHEIEATKSHEEVLALTDMTPEVAHAKQSGLVATIDVPKDAYPALWPLYLKKVAPLSGLVSVGLQNVGDKPLSLVVEVAVDGAETARESETLQRAHSITLALTPELKAGSPLAAPKAAEPHEVTVTITGGADHGVLYHETSKVTFEPASQMPKVLRAHGEDLRSAFALEAAWVTPAVPAIPALVDAAKARLHAESKKFDGAAGPSLPQAQALWDELRSRGVAFRRDPHIDSELDEGTECGLPGDVLAAGTGNALESSVLFASLLEAVGLHAVLVRTPGHRMVGWLATTTDLAATESAAQALKSPLGQAFFVETTTVGDGPFDAAVLRGDAEWVAATNDRSVASGRAQVESLADLRHRGIVPRAE